MPVFDVLVTWKETGSTEREFQVTAPSKKVAIEKALERFRSYYSRIPEDYEIKLADEKFQKRIQRHAPISDFTPRKAYRFADRINRTNEPGTCLWCGKKLKRAPSDPEFAGHYADNSFCNLRCGYEFGVTAAMLNFRLKERSDQQENS